MTASVGPGRKGPPDHLLAACATCPGHCCKGDTIVLHPELGEEPATFDAYPVPHPLTGEPAWVLRHKPNGDCIYLGEVGGVGRCTIYERRPVICRAFDCGLAFAKLSRAERRTLVRSGVASRDVFDKGREVQAARARAGPPSKGARVG
jgi:Fe-S-cluster containining protein